jgi:DNA sulfur modification protein DndC
MQSKVKAEELQSCIQIGRGWQEPADKILDRLGGKLATSLDVLEEAARKFPDLPWEVGFSGGKDSTVLCHLVLEYVKQASVEGCPLPPKVYILYSDTLLDLPILRRHTISTLKKMESFCAQFNGLVEVRILKPAPGQDYFTLLIEKGYPAPHYRFRWCMDRLKIDPTLDFLQGIGKFVMISGVRRDESQTRRRNLQRRNQTQPIAEVDGVVMVAPLLDWGLGDIWDFLTYYRQPWSGESYAELFEIYRLGDNLEGCGRCALTPNSRFGCWVCTVVRKDRLLNSLAPLHQEYKIMLEAKERIRQISTTPRFRVIAEDGHYKGLNEEGRLEIVNTLADILLSAPDALEGYIEDERLKQKIMAWLTASHSKTRNPLLKKALQLLGNTRDSSPCISTDSKNCLAISGGLGKEIIRGMG